MFELGAKASIAYNGGFAIIKGKGEAYALSFPFYFALLDLFAISLYNKNALYLWRQAHSAADRKQQHKEETKTMKQTKTVKMAQLAILTAILIVMALTPLGYLRLTPGLEITFMVIPVVMGAIVMGPAAGSLLGGIFGLTSFYQCISGLSAFGAALFSMNPALTFIVCLLPRILIGLFSGLLFKAMALRGKTAKNWAYFLACFIGSLTNTVLFITLIWVFFGKSEFILGLTGNSAGIIALFSVLAGVNALVEIPVNTALGGVISKGVDTVLRKSRASN